MYLTEEDFNYINERKRKFCKVVAIINCLLTVVALAFSILVSIDEEINNPLPWIVIMLKMVIVSAITLKIAKTEIALEYKNGNYYFNNPGQMVISIILHLLFAYAGTFITWILSLPIYGEFDLEYYLTMLICTLIVEACLLFWLGRYRYNMRIVTEETYIQVNFMNKVKKINLENR